MKKVRKCCSNHPVLTVLFLVLIVAAVIFAIAAIAKAARKENDLPDDEEWGIDEDGNEELYFYSGDEEVAEGV